MSLNAGEKVEFDCEMTCDSCKTSIEHVLKPVPGLKVLDIDVDRQRVLLELHSDQVNVHQIQSLIEDKTGIRTVVKGMGTSLAAVSEIHGQDVVGVVRMIQLMESTCSVDGVIDGVRSGPKESYSLNIHEFGDLSGEAYENVGPTFVRIANPLKVDSKYQNRSSFRLQLSNCDLSASIGRSMAISDEVRKKVLGAGIVARASPVGENQKKICACSGKTLWEERETFRAVDKKQSQLMFNLSVATFQATNGQDSQLDSLLKRTWTDAQEKGVFRFLVNEGSIHSKVIAPGKYGFIAQLNQERHTLRRKPQAMHSLNMPFNREAFNFTKVKPQEVLFRVKLEKSGEEATIVVNNSPIEYGSSLLIPFLDDCLPQILTPESVKLALSLVASSGHKSLRMGFNSLGAAASVNHLHWHLYYFNFDLALESIEIRDNQLKDWPIKGHVFETTDLSLSAINEVTEKANILATYCMKTELAHNVFITRTRSGDALRLIFWTRDAAYGAKDDSVINPALCEFSGFFICKSKEMFDSITEDFCVELMSCLDSQFEAINQLLIK